MNYIYDQDKLQKHVMGENLVEFPVGIAQGQVESVGTVLGKRRKESPTSLFRGW